MPHEAFLSGAPQGAPLQASEETISPTEQVQVLRNLKDTIRDAMGAFDDARENYKFSRR